MNERTLNYSLAALLSMGPTALFAQATCTPTHTIAQIQGQAATQGRAARTTRSVVCRPGPSTRTRCRCSTTTDTVRDTGESTFEAEPTANNLYEPTRFAHRITIPSLSI